MKPLLISTGLVLLVALAGCGSADAPPPTGAHRATPVTAVAATARRVEVLERSVARLQAPSAPAVAAETAGRVTRVQVDAGHEVAKGDLLAELDTEVQSNNQRAVEANAARLEALLANQEKTVARLEDLVQRELASASALDDAASQLASLKAQLDQARAQLDDARRNLQQTRILSPVAGIIQSKSVSVGDFVAIGQPLFEIVNTDRLQAIAPFPETIGGTLQVGQEVYVAPVRAPDDAITSTITELRPQIGLRSRAVDVIIELDNPGGWRPGGSVTVAVVVEARENAVTVPSESVVLRPAGTIVYVVQNGVARQRMVETGQKSAAWVEIRDGLATGEMVVQKGAGFLTDGADIAVQQAAP